MSNIEDNKNVIMPDGGERIDNFVKRLMRIAAGVRQEIEGCFNGINFAVNKDTTETEAINDYLDKLQEAHEEHLASIDASKDAQL